jgi:hypothetical protein
LFFGLIVLANAGDYDLTISDEVNAPCAPPIASRDNTNNPIRTSGEIVEDIYRYFHGEKPKLGIFRAVFGNARIIFCGKQEKENIYKALIQVARFQKISHESDLYDFMFVLGNNDLLNMIDSEISKNNSPTTQSRLYKAKNAVNKRYKSHNNRVHGDA